MDLTRGQLESETGASAQEIDHFIGLGVVRPGSGGGFSWADVHRVRIVRSILATGVAREHLERAIGEGLMDFSSVSDLFLPPSSPRGRTYAQIAGDLGSLGTRLPRVYENLGLVQPPPNRVLRQDEEELITELVTAWSTVGDDQVVARAARLVGDGVQRAVEGWVGLWVERQGPGRDEGGLQGRDDLAGLDTAARLASLLPRLLVWLEQRVLEQTLNAVNATLFEQELARRGWTPPEEPNPPAVVFVDISGFTRLTEERGDHAALEVGEMLYARVSEAGRRWGGRLIKLLGDGAMLWFPDAARAVDASLEVIGRGPAWPDDLPPARAGVEAGNLIEQDGDLFGHTVNKAARLCSVASAGEVVVGQGVVDVLSRQSGWQIEGLGVLQLKGFAEPVSGYRVTGAAPK